MYPTGLVYSLLARLIGHGGGSGIRTHGAFTPHKFSRLGCYDRFSTPPWWKDLYLLKHLILDGAGLPVTARAYTGLHVKGIELRSYSYLAIRIR